MRKGARALAGVLITVGAAAAFSFGPASAFAQGVRVIANEAQRRVDITIDGKPFTSYIWPTSLKKPVLYPLVTDEGITVTRGYPLDPRPGERVDHPHHAGLWFNYGDVNGFDFWNNSDAIKPEDRAKMGSILQTKIVSTKSGTDRGELVVESVWVTGTGKQILDQTTRYIFARQPHGRAIDEVVTLKALDRAVFHDDKEGVLGLRVASWLESPDEKGGTYLDASGKPTQVESGSYGRRERRVPHQRRSERRRGLGNARTVVFADRAQRRSYRHDCHSRSSRQSWLSDLLARAGLWTVCRESAGAEHFRSQAAGVQLHAGKRSDRDVPVPGPVAVECGKCGGTKSGS